MSSARALEGLKILDFTRVYSGPYCTMLLADLGAEVIKVEAVGRGDDTRAFYPIKNGQSGYFNYLNRSKKSITLNLKSDEGLKVAMDLAKWADVVVENFSAGTMNKLGLGYDDMIKVNPSIIFASISGFGQTGPHSNRVCYDGVAQSMGGLTFQTGYIDGEPVKVGPAISDAATGIHAATAILAALHYRTRTGEGQFIDMSMQDTVFSMLENSVPIHTMMGIEPQRMGNSNPASAPYNSYRTKDGSLLIGTANDGLFMKLSAAMGQPDLIKEPRFSSNPNRKAHQDEIDPIVEAWTLQHTMAEVEALLVEARVPVAIPKKISELIDDPQLKYRGMLVEHTAPGIDPVIYPGNPLALTKTPPDASMPAPQLSEHTDVILRDVLSYSEDDIKALHDSAAV